MKSPDEQRAIKLNRIFTGGTNKRAFIEWLRKAGYSNTSDHLSQLADYNGILSSAERAKILHECICEESLFTWLESHGYIGTLGALKALYASPKSASPNASTLCSMIPDQEDLTSLVQWLEKHGWAQMATDLETLLQDSRRGYSRRCYSGGICTQTRAEYFYNWLKGYPSDLNDMIQWLDSRMWKDTADLLARMRYPGRKKAPEKGLFLRTDVTSFERGDKVLSPNPLIDASHGGIVLMTHAAVEVAGVPANWRVYRCHTWGTTHDLGGGRVRVGRCVVREDATSEFATLSNALRALPTMSIKVKQTYANAEDTLSAAMRALAIGEDCLVNYIKGGVSIGAISFWDLVRFVTRAPQVFAVLCERMPDLVKGHYTDLCEKILSTDCGMSDTEKISALRLLSKVNQVAK